MGRTVLEFGGLKWFQHPTVNFASYVSPRFVAFNVGNSSEITTVHISFTYRLTYDVCGKRIFPQ